MRHTERGTKGTRIDGLTVIGREQGVKAATSGGPSRPDARYVPRVPRHAEADFLEQRRTATVLAVILLVELACMIALVVG